MSKVPRMVRVERNDNSSNHIPLEYFVSGLAMFAGGNQYVLTNCSGGVWIVTQHDLKISELEESFGQSAQSSLRSLLGQDVKHLNVEFK